MTQINEFDIVTMPKESNGYKLEEVGMHLQ
jgi:hypothetical protein